MLLIYCNAGITFHSYTGLVDRLKCLASPYRSNAAAIDVDEETATADAIGSARRVLFELGLGTSIAAQQGQLQQQDVDGSSRQQPREKHIMLSYSWSQQDLVTKIRKALGYRGYDVWIDIERMRGSTVDCMASAVENSAIVLYCVSKDYKER